LPIEIERKFLVANDSWKSAVIASRQLRDGLIARIKNPRSKLRGIGGRKEADQKNAASCGEYVPKEI
jgi:CYTH domain-containing protein